MSICVAHRGWSGKAPENTLAAIQLAIDHPAAEMVEIDVQLSKDGVPVIIHDYFVDRTTNGKGRVSSLTLDELKSLDASHSFRDEFENEQIPTLKEVLELCRGKIKVAVEIKTAGNMHPGIVEAVVETIKNTQTEKDVILFSFENHLVKKAKELLPEVEIGLLFAGHPLLLFEQLEVAHASFVSMHYEFLTAELAKSIFEKGYNVIVWNINTEEEVKKFNSYDPRINICTNHLNLFETI